MKLYEIKSDLQDFVRNYFDLEKELKILEGNSEIYKEILENLFNCISGDYSDTLSLGVCLETLFGNKYNDLQDYIFKRKILKNVEQQNSEEFKLLTKRIVEISDDIKNEYNKNKNRCEFIKNELSSKRNEMIVCKRVLTCLRYKQIISKEDAVVLNKILRDLQYSDTDVAILIENIFVRNKSIITSQTGKHFNIAEKYKFIDLLSMGSELFEYPLVEDENKLLSYSNSIFSILEDYSDDISDISIINILPVVGKDIKSELELEFVLVNVLERLRDSLNEKIELIKDSDFILELEIKNEIADECYRLIDLYNLIRNYIDTEIYKVKGTVDNEPVDVNNNEVNNLFYLNNQSGNCYFITDIEKMPFEYLGKVYELLVGFKNNSISKKKDKSLTENASARGFRELKGDQVRIIYKRIKDNDYLIYGAFIKKDDRKYKIQFEHIVERTGFISDNSPEIEEQINEYVNQNSRKWSR